MKTNIDFTESRIFSTRSADLWNFTPAFFIQKEFPWSRDLVTVRSGDEYDLDHQKRSILPIGNKEQRAEVKELRKMDSRLYCDCCGARLNKIPWDRSVGLCKRCYDYYMKDDPHYDKCEWRIK